MVRFLFVCLLSVALLIPCFSATADPETSLQRLIQSAKGLPSRQVPPVVLSEEEENELINIFIESKKQAGVTYTKQQAAIAIGLAAGYTALKREMAEAFNGSENKSQPPTSSLPAPRELPSGLPLYEANDIYSAFTANEFATTKTLSESSAVCVDGKIQKIASEDYYTDPSNLMSRKGKYPRITLENFEAYLTKAPADLSTVTPGQTALLVCENFAKGMLMTVQAECSLVLTGHMDQNDNFQRIFINKDLHEMLFKQQK